MDFKFADNDEYTIYLMNKGVEVGRLSADDMIPERLFERLETVEESLLVSSHEKLNEYAHLSYITIYEQFRHKGYFTKAMELFEQHTKELNFTAITLFANKNLVSSYKNLGYEELVYLDSIDCFLMKKEIA